MCNVFFMSLHPLEPMLNKPLQWDQQNPDILCQTSPNIPLGALKYLKSTSDLDSTFYRLCITYCFEIPKSDI